MAIWRAETTLEQMHDLGRRTMFERIGIEFIEIGPDFLRARMPVDERTLQPYGLLHGGATAALAETLGSVGSNLIVDLQRQRAAGIELNANHVRSATAGWVIGTCRPLHLGRAIHVWDIRVEDEAGRLISVARLTVAVVALPPERSS